VTAKRERERKEKGAIGSEDETSVSCIFKEIERVKERKDIWSKRCQNEI
jgi:hypothetical protein